MGKSEWISFLTDYGLENKFTGVCRGVMAKIAPHATVLDITHLVPRGDVRHGAEILRQAIPFLPAGVHLSVVDPGVGTSRRAVAVVAGHSVMVGPDNGLLLPAAEEIGGVKAAYELTDSRFHLDDVSYTFHGRDIFSPVAAHIAAGVDPAELGPSVDIADLVRLPEPVRRLENGALHGEVLIEDRFGNLQTSIDHQLLVDAGLAFGARLTLRTNDGEVTFPYVETFGSVPEGQLLAHVDSAGRLAIAVNLGNAADLLGIHEHDTFTLHIR